MTEEQAKNIIRRAKKYVDSTPGVGGNWDDYCGDKIT